MNNDNKPNKKLIHQGHVFSLYREEVNLPNGKRAERDIIRHPGAVVIIPVSADNKIYFIKQYRHAVNDYLIELPAGTLELNESPLDCAKREVREETGYSANDWTELGVIYPTPGFCDELQYLYLAKDLKQAELPKDEDEIIELQPCAISDVAKLITSNAIKDAKTLSALFIAECRVGLLGGK